MDDIPKIGITGMPSVGKTQTLIKIIEKIEKSGYKLEGMITTPLIEKKKRVGFYVEDWQTKEKEIFARLDLDSKDKVGKYGVDLAALERVGVKAIEKAINDGYSVVIFPKSISEKDLNLMSLAGHDVQSVVESNVYRGLEAKLRLQEWKKKKV